MSSTRISSIDIFRALTMLLMIFVNDLWSIHDIPAWLEHARADEDRMGLADVVFPAFLFIVGLSIPFAVDARKRKGETSRKIFIHIIQRTAALVIMGFFMVNFESFQAGTPRFYKPAWEVLMIIAFVLIWNNYRQDDSRKRKIPVIYLQLTGFLLLVILALTYRGGTTDEPQWMRTHWWGILGLIGWAYLLGALVYFLAKGRIWLIVIAWIILLALNVQEFTGLPGDLPTIRLVVSASNHALVMSGILATVWYKKLNERGKTDLFIGVLVFLGLVSLAFGFLLRPSWGISKIYATPSWTAICAGISYLVYSVFYLLADIGKFTAWSSFLGPAGRSTLTCYLVPYVVYPIFGSLIMMLPAIVTGGIPGLIKSLLFALLIVWITGLLEKVNIRLKI